MISREELQDRLRIFGSPLDQCIVKPRSTMVFCPEHEANIGFMAQIYGQRELVDIEVDLRSIVNEQSILNLVSKITQALQARAAELGRK